MFEEDPIQESQHSQLSLINTKMAITKFNVSDVDLKFSLIIAVTDPQEIFGALINYFRF